MIVKNVTLPKGWTAIVIGRTTIIAHNGENSCTPYVVWHIDGDSVIWGCYYAEHNVKEAYRKFISRELEDIDIAPDKDEVWQ